jgi:Tfp pilus assembly PilM family ATPase
VGNYAFDFQQLSRNVTDGYNDYLVAAYRQEAVQRCSEMLRAARLQPVIVDLDLFALVNAFEFNYHDATSKPAIIALGDSDRIILTLTQNGNFIDFEVVTNDAGFQDAGVCAKAMIAGIDVLHGANASVWGGVRPDVWLAGSLFTQADLVNGIKNGMERTELFNPFSSVTCRAEIAEEDIKRFSPQLAVAVGLAVRGGKDLHHD